ncbi:hypothetical protein PPL_10573 [Heterostelium album PN500]|uniref:Transmembrane protein n=1 Tax=Heterostelium pallidum (strain ATCC 26659 / Pp 5 / PN500) TaxID=670386 RepID=D3BRG3_HETP5|nr:hypothetical protein PPL_10573 [Heterostelium album PN500]EFA75995.1 hypothetical protein PPL_10573 [Heterostelium album PN500]|eukprot:XP_020428129.1 hypothetical protein PPL_10573 [Heterostelium album PN500]
MTKLTLYDKFSIIAIFLMSCVIILVIPSFKISWYNFTQFTGEATDIEYRFYYNHMTIDHTNVSVYQETDPRDVGLNSVNKIISVSYIFNILICAFCCLTLVVVILHRVFFVRHIVFSFISRYSLILVFFFSVLSTFIPRLMSMAINSDCDNITQVNTTIGGRFCMDMNGTGSKYFSNGVKAGGLSWGFDIGWSFSPILAPFIILGQIVLYLSEPLYGSNPVHSYKIIRH